MRNRNLLVLSLVVALSGCSGLSGKPQNEPLIPAAQPPVADVPIPAGFAMTTDSTSKVVPGNAIRFVDHRYEGSDDLLPVVKFYQVQMPDKKWTLVDQSQPSGKEVALHFTKNNEDCVVTVTRHTFNTLIEVRIDPAGRNAPK